MSIVVWIMIGVFTGVMVDRLAAQPSRRRLVHPAVGALGAIIGGFGYHMLAGLGFGFHVGSLVGALGSAILVLQTFKWLQYRGALA